MTPDDMAGVSFRVRTSIGRLSIFSRASETAVSLHATASGKAWLASLPHERAVQLALQPGLRANVDARENVATMNRPQPVHDELQIRRYNDLRFATGTT
jgi:DNA-binding IclR family transcriptional regulator